jgi:hypothetical protein
MSSGNYLHNRWVTGYNVSFETWVIVSLLLYSELLTPFVDWIALSRALCLILLQWSTLVATRFVQFSVISSPINKQLTSWHHFAQWGTVNIKGAQGPNGHVTIISRSYWSLDPYECQLAWIDCTFVYAVEHFSWFLADWLDIDCRQVLKYIKLHNMDIIHCLLNRIIR